MKKIYQNTGNTGTQQRDVAQALTLAPGLRIDGRIEFSALILPQKHRFFNYPEIRVPLQEPRSPAGKSQHHAEQKSQE